MQKHPKLDKDVREGLLTAGFAVLMIVIGLIWADDMARTGIRTAALAADVIGSFDRQPAPQQRGVPVLCHHYLRDDTRPHEIGRIVGSLFLNMPLLGDMGVWTQTRGSFEREMRYLSENGYQSIDLDDVAAWRRGEVKLPEKSVVITFDDGDRSVMKHALPVLEKYGMKATLFLVTGKVGEDWQAVRGMDWDEIRSLHASGRFSIQSHTHDMHYKVKTADGELPVFLAASQGFREAEWRQLVMADLAKSRSEIEQHIGTTPRHLAWPFGFGDAELDSLALAAGFETISTLYAGDVIRDDDAAKNTWEDFKLRRYTITARTSIRSFERMLARDTPPN